MKYRHKQTGMIFEAEKYKVGMEDGWVDPTNSKISKEKLNDDFKPCMIIDEKGIRKYALVDDTKIIVYNRGFKFLFNYEWFLKNYEVISE